MTAWKGVLALMLAGGTSATDWFRCGGGNGELVEILRSDAGRRRLSRRLGKTVGPVDWDRFETQVDMIERLGVTVLCATDEAYPDCMTHLEKPPPLLFCKGDIARLRSRGIAVVGTRKPSSSGTALARKLGADISATGVAVISGLARGIDTAAHAGALSQPGGTVAVVGTGLDVPYPAENAALMVEVTRNGCVVSEQLMGMPPAAHVFPLRNRLISALAHAVVVVEGGVKSGALITARWALEQGRDVGAVPGFPGDFRSRGPNSLLRQGAFVVESAGDIFDAVPVANPVKPVSSGSHATADEDESDPEVATVLSMIAAVPVDADDVATASNLDVEIVQRVLSRLEIEGRVTRDDSGGYVRFDQQPSP